MPTVLARMFIVVPLLFINIVVSFLPIRAKKIEGTEKAIDMDVHFMEERKSLRCRVSNKKAAKA